MSRVRAMSSALTRTRTRALTLAGAYLKLDLSTATLRRGGSPIFGRSTSPRFEPSPSLDRLTPSPVHYAPDHTRPSRG